MQCPRCQHENPPESNFCLGCGARLALTCASCGTPLPAGSRFCNKCSAPVTAEAGVPARFTSPESYTPKHLAEKIFTSRSALEGERKQVTVLFADVAGFSALAEHLDPERIHELMNGCFELLARAVHRYEGTINQFTGDGIMALFGAPITHEDHAARALQAALDIQADLEEYGETTQRRWGVPFQMRIGINTGTVVVGTIGDNLRMDYTAQGDTTNLAARLQQMAETGAIWVSEDTHRLDRGAFEWRDLGSIAVKGRGASVQTYELLGRRAVRGRFESHAQRGLTRFVGRDPEFQMLLAGWGAAQQGRGQIMSVVGEAGLGKSRLIHEFKTRLEGEGARCLEGSCFAYGDTISYLPFLEIIKAHFELDGIAGEAAAKRQIGERLAVLAVDAGTITPYLHNLLAYGVEDEVFHKLPSHLVRERTVTALKSLVLGLAAQRPLALIIEDVHWIDKATEEVIGAVVEAMETAPLLFLLVYRPEYLHAWATKAYHTNIPLNLLPRTSGAEMVRAILQKPYASRVPLARLSPGDSTALVQELLGTALVPPELERLVVGTTDGNPLFIEELTRSLLESGDLRREDSGYVLPRPLEALRLPTTVQGVLLARIDRLNERLKLVLQVASVIGRVFSYPVLAQVVEQGTDLDEVLCYLEDLEFIYSTSLAPQREYSFKHVLTQQAVYDALLRAKREALHEEIGHAIEVLYPDRLDEHCELLAYHYLRSPNTEKAFLYLDRANLKAARANAMQEAKAYFDEAMRLLDRMPDTQANRTRRIALLANQAPVMVLLFKFAECYELLTRYEPIGVALGDSGLLGAFYGCLGHCQWFFGELDRAIATLNKATQLSDAADNPEAAGYAYMLLEWSHLYQGNYVRVLELRDLALNRLEQKFNLRTHTWALAAASMAHTFLGRWTDAVDESVREMRTSEALSDNSNISFAAMMLSLNHSFKSDLRSAVRWGELAVEKAVTPADKIWANGFYGLALCRAGEPRRATELLAEVVSIQRAAGFVGGAFFTLWLGEAYWLVGELERARETLSEVINIFERCGMRFFLASAHRLLAEIALQRTEPAREERAAADHFASSIAILEPIQADNELALAYAGYGRLHKQQGRLAEARDYLTRALEIFERLGTLIEPDKVRAELAELPHT